MEVWNPAHPHHAVWREYTQSLLDGKPKLVEVSTRNSRWEALTATPAWAGSNKYRIARPMLKLSYEVPMPVTEALEMEQKYWLASPEDKVPRRITWDNDDTDEHWLRTGLIYLTEADAQAAFDARNAAMTATLKGAK